MTLMTALLSRIANSTARASERLWMCVCMFVRNVSTWPSRPRRPLPHISAACGLREGLSNQREVQADPPPLWMVPEKKGWAGEGVTIGGATT